MLIDQLRQLIEHKETIRTISVGTGILSINDGYHCWKRDVDHRRRWKPFRNALYDKSDRKKFDKMFWRLTEA
jgi:hypothetical protein